MSIKVETETSEYELTQVENRLKLQKVSIKTGCISKVPVGETFFANVVEVSIYCIGSSRYSLVFGDMHTSPIKNVYEVNKWLVGIKEDYLNKLD